MKYTPFFNIGFSWFETYGLGLAVTPFRSPMSVWMDQDVIGATVRITLLVLDIDISMGVEGRQ